jgi:hypothetical protein
MLKGLAAASLPQPEAADALNGLAEQWWVAAEKAKGRDKADLQFAAACFYTDALPGLTGLARLKVEQRLNDLGTDVTKAVARTRTTNLRSARLLYSDEFDASSVGWVTAGTDPKVSGYSDGCLYVANGRGGSTWSARPWSASNFACVLVGRVKSEASASWGLVLESAEGRFGIRVSVTNDQKLGIRPFSNDLPGITLGLFDLPQLKPGAEFGTLVVTVRQSRMEVYVNGSRVCEPVSLPNIDTIKLRCIVVCSKPARAEFERIAVYALPPDEAAASALAKNLSSLDSSTRLPESPTSDEQLDRSVALWVLSRGGDVALAPPSKRWGPLPYFNDAAKLPATPFPLLAIRLTNNGSINDQDMARIEHLTNLVHLRVDGTSLGNETLAHAARVGSLKFLNFQGTRITDDGLALLEKMPQLTYLSLRGTGMTDLGAEHLRRLTNLEYLNISDTPITDGAIAGLGELKKLEILYISDNRLSAASCSALSGLKQLTEVSLARTKTTDADLDALTRFPNLKLLFLNETPITDQGLAVLAGIPSLETLHVEKTRVTEGGIRRFKQRVPDCRVVQ